MIDQNNCAEITHSLPAKITSNYLK